MKNIITTFLFMVLAIFVVPTAYASTTTCTPIYGGGQNCQTTQVTINKTVMNPANNTFVDNLSANDPKYAPGASAFFKLTITNTGNTTVSQTTVKDVFPQFISFASGPGNFDQGTKTLSFTLADLKANEQRTFDVVGRIDQAQNLTTGITCVTNQSLVTFDSETSQDNSQLCIEKQAEPTATQPNTPTQTSQPGVNKGGPQLFPAPLLRQTPGTGPEAIPVILSGISGIIGFALRKKAMQG